MDATTHIVDITLPEYPVAGHCLVSASYMHIHADLQIRAKKLGCLDTTVGPQIDRHNLIAGALGMDLDEEKLQRHYIAVTWFLTVEFATSKHGYTVS